VRAALLDERRGLFVECDIELSDDAPARTRKYPLLGQRELDAYGEEKLVFSLRPKKNYVIYAPQLKFALECGYRMTGVRRVLEFATAPVFSKYIRLWQGVKESEDRKTEGKNPVRREASKLFMNSLYGKTLQREDQVSTHIVATLPELSELLLTGRVRGIAILESMAMEVQCNPDEAQVKRKMPVSLGAAILAISKVIIMRYLYEAVDRGCRILYMDTDSLVTLRKISEPALSSESIDNSGTFGKMKEEYPARSIKDFIAFLPKGYAFTLEEKGKVKEVVKLKGQSYSTNYKQLRFQDLKGTIKEYVQNMGLVPARLDLR